jgi:hypothetical protein
MTSETLTSVFPLICPESWLRRDERGGLGERNVPQETQAAAGGRKIFGKIVGV